MASQVLNFVGGAFLAGAGGVTLRALVSPLRGQTKAFEKESAMLLAAEKLPGAVAARKSEDNEEKRSQAEFSASMRRIHQYNTQLRDLNGGPAG